MMYTIKIEKHDEIRYVDGPTENYHVSLLTDEARWVGDKGCVNTGKGFGTLHEAIMFADGMRLALQSLDNKVIIKNIPKEFAVSWDEVVHYTLVVEASSEEEARNLIIAGEFDVKAAQQDTEFEMITNVTEV